MSETRILLVDDEMLNLEILEAYFEDQPGVTTVTADCGEAAWAQLTAPDNRFDLILLDRMMPGLDGIGLLQRMKGEPRLAGIPVISTGWTCQGSMALGSGCGKCIRCQDELHQDVAGDQTPH